MAGTFNPEKKQIHVLSLDGGGIRGIIPAALLGEIERRAGKPVSTLFDFIAGTSTGGILSLALVQPDTSGMHPAHQALEMVQFYEELGPKIFSRPLWHRLGSAEGLLRSRYPDIPVETTLMQFFGETRLKAALTPVFVPSYELERRTPFFFRSTMACADEAYDYPMHTVARSTSAAPTYFPPEEVKNADRSYILIDGGVFANNPAACAYVEAKVQFPSASDFTVVSLGTGAPKESALMTSKADWGIAQWARPILDTVLDGVSSTVDFQLSQLLPHADDGTQRYFRIQPVLASENQSMDNVSKENLAGLKAIVARTIEEKSSVIDAICHRLS